MELAYSTDPDWCSKCKHLPCRCAQKIASSASSSPPGKVKIRREKRRGKDLVVVFETGLDKATLQQLLKQIQKAAGAGGSVKGDTLEIQGDHRDLIARHLASLGYKVVRAGG